MLHQLPPEVPLAHGLIGGGQVDNHLCPVDGLQSGGGHGGPQILADFHTHHRTVPQAEQHVPAHGNLPLLGKAHFLRGDFHLLQILRGGEPSPLVKLVIVGKIRLGYQAVANAILQHCRTVIHLASQNHRQSYRHGQLRAFPGAQGNLLKALPAGSEQCLLEKQVSAGIARQRQLREHHHICLPRIRFPDALTDIFHILSYFSHLYPGHSAGNAYIIQHGIPPSGIR